MYLESYPQLEHEMSLFKQGRYSGYLKPMAYIIDLGILNALAFLYALNSTYPLSFFLFLNFGWIILAINTKFYQVYRYTKGLSILQLTIKQFVLFTFLTFSYFGFFKEYNLSNKMMFYYFLSFFFLATFLKFTIYFLLKKYRVEFGGNFRKTVILGENKKTSALEKFFKTNQEYGFIHHETYSLEDSNEKYFQEIFNSILNEDIDEIYCSISELSNKQLNKIIDFADNNLKVVKFIPDNKEVYSKKLNYEYYGYIPILALRTIPIEDPFNFVLKRTFDIVFSSAVIILILSWLTPIIALIIKLESKGPVFFKQSRNGFNYEEFYCYKFRSMALNEKAHLKQATKNDQRITRFGRFIRKTSIDELPQFFNVLIGDMSVVGPRPHMVSHTNDFAKRIDKFMVRHFVKPGITGLAQIKGFRGEIEEDKDIINRVKYDIFYIENWSLLLDIRIILQTALNAMKGEEKAY